ncbi:hypothetical protein MMC12_007182 [Toensbergia leucococca]|nr:hypothetical protein [Toensbergia leucococca]
MASSSRERESGISTDSPSSSSSRNTRRRTKQSRLVPTNTSLDPLEVIKDVLDTLWENKVPGPFLFRLKNEFTDEVGEGRQFKVTAASTEYTAKLERALPLIKASSSSANPLDTLYSATERQLSCVVKRAHWIPDPPPRPLPDQPKGNSSSKVVARELEAQIQSTQREIHKLCNRSFRRHPNIVNLLGWGLCLDTFEGRTTFNTRIPLLILERARFDLSHLLASPEYDSATYESLRHICYGIGRGLGALHAGNTTHGDIKPENVLLFPVEGDGSAGMRGIKWNAKLCDFGTATSRPSDELSTNTTFEYYGTDGWTPPESLKGLTFDALQRCDLFTYGLVVWRVFDTAPAREAGEPPLPTEEDQFWSYRNEDLAYAQAKHALEHSDILPRSTKTSSEFNRILQVLRSSLHINSTYREPRPWRYLNVLAHTSVKQVDERTFLNQTDISENTVNSLQALISDITSMQSVSSGWVSQRVSNAVGTVANVSDKSLISIDSATRVLRRRSRRQITFDSIYERYSTSLGLRSDPNGIDVFEHDKDKCFDMRGLHHELWSTLRSVSSSPLPLSGVQYDNLYVYARLRSRFKLCCWENSLAFSRTETVVGEFLLDFSSTPSSGLPIESERLVLLAWLCYGEIGETELKSISMPDSRDYRSALWALVGEPNDMSSGM